MAWFDHLKPTIERCLMKIDRCNRERKDVSRILCIGWHVWGKVKAETICNYLAKAVISKKKQAEALLDVDGSFKDLQYQLYKHSVHTSEFFLEGTISKDVVSMNDLCNTSEQENLDGKEDKDDEVDTSIEPTCPQLGDVRQALGALRR